MPLSTHHTSPYCGVAVMVDKRLQVSAKDVLSPPLGADFFGRTQVDWDLWRTGSIDDGSSLLQLPNVKLFEHRPADPAKAHVQLVPIDA